MALQPTYQPPPLPAACRMDDQKPVLKEQPAAATALPAGQSGATNLESETPLPAIPGVSAEEEARMLLDWKEGRIGGEGSLPAKEAALLAHVIARAAFAHRFLPPP